MVDGNQSRFYTSHALRMFPTLVWKADLNREISQRINDNILNLLTDMRRFLPELQPGQAWQLPRVLRELHAALKPDGVLFCSNPRGNNEEGLSGDRYNCFFDLDTWRDYVTAAGFIEVKHYYRPPGLPRHRQPWLATVWRRCQGRGHREI